MNSANRTEVANSWDTYWQGTQDAAAFAAGGVSHPVIETFWRQQFARLVEEFDELSWVDVATGNGALINLGLPLLESLRPAVRCIDISVAAIENVRKRFPGIEGIVADATSIPLDDDSADFVSSQFGVEYAGTDAVYEAARLVNGGGTLAMLLHRADSLVHAECAASLDAIERLQTAEFVPLATDLFKKGFAAVNGADRAPYERAGSRFSEAIIVAEAVMTEHGEGVAGETIVKLYSDIARIHESMPKYEPIDVLTWLATMDGQLDQYRERMASMLGAAISEVQFQGICKKLESEGFHLQRADVLKDGTDNLGWAIIAEQHQ